MIPDANLAEIAGVPDGAIWMFLLGTANAVYTAAIGRRKAACEETPEQLDARLAEYAKSQDVSALEAGLRRVEIDLAKRPDRDSTAKIYEKIDKIAAEVHTIKGTVTSVDSSVRTITNVILNQGTKS